MPNMLNLVEKTFNYQCTQLSIITLSDILLPRVSTNIKLCIDGYFINHQCVYLHSINLVILISTVT